MKQGTRRMWLAALLALALGAGELLAYQGIAPHAKLLGDPSRAALAAGRIVARNLSGLVVAGAQAAAGDLVLRGVKQTTQAFRVAQRVLGTAGPATAVCGNHGSCAGADPEVEAVVVSEPDMPCDANRECEMALGAKLACPPCPACPSSPGRAREAAAPGTAAKLGRSGA